MGEPGTVSATYGFITGRAVEDHAVVTLGYADGGIAVAEVSFIDQPSTWELEVHGDRGMVRIAAPDMELAIRRAQANRRDRANYEPVPVPADRPTPFEQWVDRATRGEGDASHLRLARNLTRLAEAASDSARMGKVICLDRHEAG
jgi:predicted dehydrogenase